MALGLFIPYAQATPVWEDKWYPVEDDRENKIFVRFGVENGKRKRQWGNGYKTKIKFTSYIVYRGNDRGLSNSDQTVTATDTIDLAADAKTSNSLDLPMLDAELLNITAKILQAG